MHNIRTLGQALYLSYCSNRLSLPDGNCAVVIVRCSLTLMFWIDIIGSRVQCIMFRSIWWADPSVECYVIIILYTATGSVNKFDGWAGAKRAGDQQSKIGQQTKPATTSYDIFLILKAYPLWFSTHGGKLVRCFRFCASYQVFLRYWALHINCQIAHGNPTAFEHLLLLDLWCNLDCVLVTISTSTGQPLTSRSEILAWYLVDWANSPNLNVLLALIIPLYLAEMVTTYACSHGAQNGCDNSHSVHAWLLKRLMFKTFCVGNDDSIIIVLYFLYLYLQSFYSRWIMGICCGYCNVRSNCSRNYESSRRHEEIARKSRTWAGRFTNFHTKQTLTLLA